MSALLLHINPYDEVIADFTAYGNLVASSSSILYAPGVATLYRR